jgi:hypothetical protein
MHREPVPSAIVTRLPEAAKELEEWAAGHRQATLAEHERAVLRTFRSVMGPTLGAVLERRCNWMNRPLSDNTPPVLNAARDGGRTSGASASR